MRKTGLEPARYCYHQPLKLARLPISPLALRIDCVAGRITAKWDCVQVATGIGIPDVTKFEPAL